MNKNAVRPAICRGCGREYLRRTNNQMYCGSRIIRGSCSYQRGEQLSKESKARLRARPRPFVVKDFDLNIPQSAFIHKEYPTCSCGQKYLPQLGCLFCKYANMKLYGNDKQSKAGRT